jgi:hypothetical protein
MSYGEGHARLEANLGSGIAIQNCGGYELSNLTLRGSAENRESGILFETDLDSDGKLEHIRIDKVDVSGFRYGINFVSSRETTGYREVEVTGSRVHHNHRDGIRSVGTWKTSLDEGWAHQRFLVAHNEVHSNLGDPAYLENHSGSGIVLSDIDGAVIEHNIAYRNGGRNGNAGGGPVGIWAWDCNNVTIQFNESYENRKGFDEHADDGDGFDLDGGCSNSVMQYNFAHDNDGAGFLVWQYKGARPKSNVTVRYNISVNDGRELGYGGITIGGQNMDGVLIHNNTVFMAPSPTGNGKESGIVIWGGSERPTNVKIINNLLITSGNLRHVWISGVGFGLQIVGNWYDSSGGHFRGRHPYTTQYESLSSWRDGTDQERGNGQDYGSEGNAFLFGPGGSSDSDYRLKSNSPLRDKGLDLRVLLGVDPGDRDYFGHPLPQGGGYEVGAHELGHRD